NLNEFIVYLNTLVNKPNIIILSEIWIYSNEASLYNIPDYKMYCETNDENRAGGVAVYVHQTLRNLTSQLPLSSKINISKNMDMVILQIEELTLVAIYRSPSANISLVTNFISDIDNVFSILTDKCNVLFMGDINIRLEETQNSNVAMYLTTLASHGYIALHE